MHNGHGFSHVFANWLISCPEDLGWNSKDTNNNLSVLVQKQFRENPNTPKFSSAESAIAIKWCSWKWYPFSLSGDGYLQDTKTHRVREWTVESDCLDLNSSFSTYSLCDPEQVTCLICKMKILILRSIRLKHFQAQSKCSGYMK